MAKGNNVRRSEGVSVWVETVYVCKRKRCTCVSGNGVQGSAETVCGPRSRRHGRRRGATRTTHSRPGSRTIRAISTGQRVAGRTSAARWSGAA
eukprot:2625513-Rhodomonas_salina.2